MIISFVVAGTILSTVGSLLTVARRLRLRAYGRSRPTGIIYDLIRRSSTLDLMLWLGIGWLVMGLGLIVMGLTR